MRHDGRIKDHHLLGHALFRISSMAGKLGRLPKVENNSSIETFLSDGSCFFLVAGSLNSTIVTSTFFPKNSSGKSMVWIFSVGVMMALYILHYFKMHKNTKNPQLISSTPPPAIYCAPLVRTVERQFPMIVNNLKAKTLTNATHRWTMFIIATTRSAFLKTQTAPRPIASIWARHF